MFIVEYFDRLKAIHDAQPVKADSEAQALESFRQDFIIAKQWGDTVIPIAAHATGGH